jgi:site-specific recombinase XerD
MNNENIDYTTHVFYDDNYKIPEVWDQNQIQLMFQTIRNSKLYLKTIWGDWMKARDSCILAVLRYMILRPGEACQLQFNDFNWQKKTVRIRAETNKEKKARIVSIPDKFLQYYKMYMSFPKWMWKNSVYLFPSAENKFISAQRWKMIFREKVLKPSGLYIPPINTTIPATRSYLLRTSGATEMLDNGADPWTVAQTLGHGDLRTVQRYFIQTQRYRDRQLNFLNTIG